MNKAIFLSIGENHLPQAILDRHNLNSIKTPFSNVRSNIDYVTQIFDEDFADLLNKKHLRYSERYGKRILINTKYNCNNSLYHPSVSNYFEFTDSNLIENKDDWTIDGDYIVFSTDQLSDQYNDLLLKL